MQRRSWDDAFWDWYDRLPLWVQFATLPLFFVVFVATLPVAFVSLCVVMPSLIVAGLWSDWQTVRRLRRAGRWARWDDIVDRLTAGQGTLILTECFEGWCCDDAWWISDPSAVRGPDHPLPTYRQWRKPDYRLPDGLDAAVDWWCAHAMHLKHGAAALVVLPRRAWPCLDGDSIPEEAVRVAPLWKGTGP